jgi:hypothetical protein
MSAAPTTPGVAGCAAVRPAIMRAAAVRRTVWPVAAGLCLAAVASAATPVPGERGIPRDEARKTQRQTTGTPPSEPGKTPADPGAPLPALPPLVEPTLQMRRRPQTPEPTLPPTRFNPDPGAVFKPERAPAADPYFQRNQVPFPVRPQEAPLPPAQAGARAPLERPWFELTPNPPPPRYGTDALPADQKLPRAGVRENRFIPNSWHAPEAYPLAAEHRGYGPNTTPVTDRWRNTGFVSWRRYTAGDTDEIPYYHPKPERWHYYRQSVLKGDLPVRGQDLFLNLTATGEFVVEDRKLTVPSGNSASRAGSFDNFGDSRSQVFVSNLAFQADLSRGETVFKPVEWLVRVKPVFNFNHVRFRESGIVSPDPRGSLGSSTGVPNNATVTHPRDIDVLLSGGIARADPDLSRSRGTTRDKTYVSLQEAFVEKHLLDLTNAYDFCAIKVGNQTFNSDFRGFIFNDTNLGARFFGNYDSNRWQYNVAAFDLREKDTNSELNTFDRRGQLVFVANVYRQDLWRLGYTGQASFHASFDQAGVLYDTNGGIVRPAPLGTVRPHRVNSYYLGWAGDGHLGAWNISHATYLVFGRDRFNGLAGRPVDIFAQMAALEVSYDRDWIRFKGSVFFASGDRDPENGRATGFDSIVDNANFTGGPFSYYVRQGFNLGGTAVGLKQRFSLLPDLRTSKTQGQANFVNPGIFIAGYGTDLEVTPRLRAFINANYIRFVTTAPLRTALLTNRVDAAFGVDLSCGVQWRPLLTENIVISAGYGALLPGRGFRDIFRTTQPGVPGFTAPAATARVDAYLHSAILAATLTY